MGRPRRIGGLLVAALLLAARPSDAAGAEPAYQPPDCAVNSLYLLMQLAGRPAPLGTLERHLPPRRPEGYAMSDLQAAAGAAGLRLRGVRFAKAHVPLDRPAIAFMAKPGAGHFVVLNPVGTTGTRVQVLEPPFAPQLVDYADLMAGSVWTGKLLVPETAGDVLIGWAWLVPLAVLVGLLVAAGRRPRTRAVPAPAVAGP